MTTINSEMFDALIHRQIDIGRYSKKQVNDIVSLLNDADTEIVAKLLKRGESVSWTAKRLDALLAEIKQIIQDTYNSAGDALKSEMGAFAEHSGEFAATTLASQFPVSWSPVSMSKEQLAAIVDTTPIRIGQNKSLLFDEIFSALAKGKEEKVRGALRLGMVEGESVIQMVQRLKGTKANRYADGVLEASRRDLANIVHTVTQHTNNMAAQMTMQNNSEVLKGWIYASTLDSKTCSYCFSKSGKKYPLEEGPIPPLHISCRCFQAPWIATWRELGYDIDEMPASTRASSSGQVRADISFNDWLATQNKKTQVELLGPTRAKIFGDGKMKLDKFTDASGKLLTLEQLKGR